MNSRDNHDLSAAYAESVDHERAKWQALQAQPPGTPARAAAWEEWSQAIVRTNHAWRRLSASRIADPLQHVTGWRSQQPHARA